MALLPDSELFLGWMVSTPFPLAVNPTLEPLVLAGRLGWMVPQMSMPRPANHC